MMGGLVLAAGLMSGSPAHAQDDDKTRAREQFQQGVEQYEAGNYERALDAFQEAYRIKPNPMVRLNMANCYEELDRPLEALFHYEQFLEESKDASPGRRQKVREKLERLRVHVGKMQLQVAPDGARVTIDGQQTRRAPIHDMIRLEAGEHTVEVAHEGYQTVERTVELPGGGTERVMIRLERRVSATDATSTETSSQPESSEEPKQVDTGAMAGTGEQAEGSADDPEPRDRSESASALSAAEAEPDTPAMTPTAPAQTDTANEEDWKFRMTTPVVASGTVTLGLAGSALATGILAMQSNSDFDDAVARSNDPSLSADERARARQAGLDASDKADRRALATDILLGATAAGAAVTTFFIVSEGFGREAESPSEARVSVQPAVGRQSGGVTVRGSF
jgi:hypothetical protein